MLANEVAFAENLETSLLYLLPRPGGWTEVAIAPEVLARYAGTYERADGSGHVFVRLEAEGFLTYQALGSLRTRLYPRSDSVFYSLTSPWSTTFRGGSEYETASMIMEEDERTSSPTPERWAADRVAGEAPPSDVVAGGVVPATPERRGPWWRGPAGLAAAIALGVGVWMLRERVR